MRPDIHTLTGAYALDALPDDERVEFETHLEVCDACAEEVRELRATATELGSMLRALPSPELRERVLDEVDRTRQDPPDDAADLRDRVLASIATTDQEPVVPPPPVPADPRRAGPPRWVTGLLAAATVVAVTAVAGLTMYTSALDDRLAQVESASGQVVDLLAAPDARTVEVDAPGGAVVRVVVSPSRGEAMFVVDGMDPAPHEHVYELWVIGDEGPAPAGMFDTDERGRATRMVTGDLAGAAAIGVTVEPEGGSPVPSSDPIMLVDL